MDPAESVERYFRLRSVLDAAPLREADALVLIAGADGRWNWGSSAVLKYLFLGASSRELEDGTLSDAHGPLDDVFLVVSRSGARAFYPPAAASLVAPLLQAWGDVEAMTCSESEYEDTEAFEAFKIRCFLAAVADAGAVAMPLTGCWSHGAATASSLREAVPRSRPDAAAPAANAMEAESWPLVQAFGVTEMGQGGFFTMTHAVLDASPWLAEAFREVDPTSARALLSRPGLLRQWRALARSMDAVRTPSIRGRAAAGDVAEPVLTYYDFSRIRQEADGESTAPHRGPRARVGAATARPRSLDSEEERAAEEAALREPPVAEAGGGRRPAVHITIEGEDPASGLRAARTYLMHTGHAPPPDAAADALVSGAADPADAAPGEGLEEEEGVAVRARAAGALYVALLESLHAAACALQRGAAEAVGNVPDAADAAAPGVRGVSSDVSDRARFAGSTAHAPAARREAYGGGGEAAWRALEGEVNGAALAAFLEALAAGVKRGAPQLPPAFRVRDALTVEVELTDASGRPVASRTPRSLRRGAVFVRAALGQLPPMGDSPEPWGALVAGDTYLLACGGPRGGPLPLTADAPYLRAWPSSEAEGSWLTAARRLTSDSAAAAAAFGLGETVGDAVDHVTMLALVPGAAPRTLPLRGRLRLFSQGLLYATPAHGPLAVSTRAIRAMRYLRNGSTLALALALHGSAAPSWAGLGALCAAPVLILPLPPAGEVAAALGRAAREWTSAGGSGDTKLPVDDLAAVGDRSDVLGQGVAEAAAIALEAFAEGEESPSVEGGLGAAAAAAARHDVLHAPLLPPAAAAASGEGDEEEEEEATRLTRYGSVPVHIVAGAAGAGVPRLARSLAAFSAAENEWFVIGAGAYASTEWDETSALASVRSAVTKAWQARASLARAGRRPRVLVVAPANVHPGGVEVLVRRAGGEIATSTRLSPPAAVAYVASATACVSAHDLAPAPFAAAAAGWASCVAITDVDEAPAERIADLKRELRRAAPHASVVGIEGSGDGHLLLTRGDVADLAADDAFQAPALRRARALSLPARIPLPAEGYVSTAVPIPTDPAPLPERLDAAIRLLVKCTSRVPAFREPGARDSASSGDGAKTGSWRDQLRTLTSTAAADVSLVDGLVPMGENGQMRRLHATSARVRHFSATLPDDAQHRNSVLIVLGRGVSRPALERILALCRPGGAGVGPARTRESLTEEELEAIRKEHLSDPLPSGWWFDGHHFVDFAGTQRTTHPNMDAFIDQYLQRENERPAPAQ